MNSNIQPSSVRAYYNDAMPTLGDRHRAVLQKLGKGESLTNSELAGRLGWPINTVTPRIHELRAKGLVEFADERVCRVTGRKVMAWRLIRRETLFG
jgi:Mn-dependent DtxR family transcriptional regulator